MKRLQLITLFGLCLLLNSCHESDTIDESPSIDESPGPQLLSMSFCASANPHELVEDVACSIIGDSVVECWVRHVMDGKQLIPHIDFKGDGVYVGGQEFVADSKSWDFSRPVRLVVRAGARKKEYTVYVHAFTGLPVLWIETEGRADIRSKKEYLNARFRIVEDVRTRSAGDVKDFHGRIKGRGNSTWTAAAKKSYRLKLDRKVSLLDEPEDKSWVLLANYFDKTMLRIATAFYMGSISQLDYTPRSHFVEVMLNGRYDGTYQLCEKLKISKNRVDVGDNGFLLEIDAKSTDSDVTFRTEHIPNPVSIKEPDEMTDEEYNYIKGFVNNAEKALFADNFTDKADGWQKYMDIDSFADWYLINEIAKNNDAVFFTSCYMNLRRGGKLKMGPIWDFDIAFGNVNYNNNYNAEGFWVRRSSWFSRLFQDPAFTKRVKERFEYFYNHQDDLLKDINENADYLRFSAIENENRWGTLYNYTWPNYDIWGSYINEVQYMKTWIRQRLEWLRGECEKL